MQVYDIDLGKDITATAIETITSAEALDRELDEALDDDPLAILMGDDNVPTGADALEFDSMIIVEVNNGIVPLAAAAEVDSDYARMEFTTKECSRLYVATTRAKNRVLITCHGEPSKFIV